MLNHSIVMGRLTRDVELRRTGSGVAVASFCLAVDRDYNPKDGGEKETDFIDCTAWRSTAEFVSKYFGKGSMAVVSGRLQIRNYTDKDGNKRRAAEIVADAVYFGDSKKNDQGGTSYTPAPNGSQSGSGDFSESMAALNHYMKSEPQNDYALLDDNDAQLPF